MKVYAIKINFIVNAVAQRFGMFFIPCKKYVGFEYKANYFWYYFTTKEDAERALNVIKRLLPNYDRKFVDGTNLLEEIKIEGIFEENLTHEKYEQGMSAKPKKVTIAKKDKDYFEGFDLIDVEWI